MYTVYSLVDPRSQAARYVGITDDVYKRFAQHLQCTENNLDKNEWIQGLKDEDLMLILCTLEVIETVEEAREREQHWIHYYLRQGAKLLNIDIARSFSYEDFQSFFEAKPKKVRQPVDTSHGAAQQRARRVLKRYPDIGPTALAKKAQISKSYACKILSEMVQQSVN